MAKRRGRCLSSKVTPSNCTGLMLFDVLGFPFASRIVGSDEIRRLRPPEFCATLHSVPGSFAPSISARTCRKLCGLSPMMAQRCRIRSSFLPTKTLSRWCLAIPVGDLAPSSGAGGGRTPSALCTSHTARTAASRAARKDAHTCCAVACEPPCWMIRVRNGATPKDHAHRSASRLRNAAQKACASPRS